MYDLTEFGLALEILYNEFLYNGFLYNEFCFLYNEFFSTMNTYSKLMCNSVFAEISHRISGNQRSTMAGGGGDVAKLDDWQVGDPVHGLMEFPGLIRKIVDTRQFQRLRAIKQLGGSYFVYPAADHSRFSHSLGVANLAYQKVQRLRHKSPPYGEVSHSSLLCCMK